MKRTLAITAGLALAIGLAGWRNQGRISTIQAERKALHAEAEKLGITTGADTAGTEAAAEHRRRPDREAAAKATAAEVIAFAKEMEAMQKQGGNPNADMEGFQERILGLMDRMTSLDSAQLKALIAEFRNAPGLSDEIRQGLIGFSVMTLSKEHPRTALELFTESSDLFPDNRMSKHMVSGALGEWAKKDPDAALEWMRTNKEKHSDLITGQAKQHLISGIAQTDPQRAFQLLAELSDGSSPETYSPMHAIMQAARTPAQRTATLEAFREYAAGLPAGDGRTHATQQALSQLASQMAGEGFESSTAWVASAKLSPEEMEAFSDGITYNSKPEDKAKWIGWVSETLPPEKSASQVKQIVNQWTRDDYKAAGEWLVAEPDGPSKNTAIQAYAETVAPYEPDTAAQWALTLPAGKERDATLKRIHREMKGKDEAAAAAFAQKHGIK
ncbi:hypothetical protein OVA24_04180 [Luteolibacter sp. SL250]|uniref:hypothetical protein n=1 Tax=Luteolibacter sp. SL250 TaxID=2995170 RepID=UPI002271A8A1|nr:hypothetical protein [Luteolibacter sp. SL250]WAC20575.1 hypothetical protein OVA24_04180 [Luteolibacter sp. SL250]